MLAGRLITLVGCIMYIFVEFIPVNRRWWMLVCYLLFGVGFGMKQKQYQIIQYQIQYQINGIICNLYIETISN